MRQCAPAFRFRTSRHATWPFPGLCLWAMLRSRADAPSGFLGLGGLGFAAVAAENPPVAQARMLPPPFLKAAVRARSDSDSARHGEVSARAALGLIMAYLPFGSRSYDHAKCGSYWLKMYNAPNIRTSAYAWPFGLHQIDWEESTMSDKSSIEWTDATWNPVTGCTKITKGCANCYAERFAERFRGVPGHPYEKGFDLTLRSQRLMQPLTWKRPRMIFVNSMSDLFHKGIPANYIDQVFDTMEAADWHIFQVLTKRSSLMRDYLTRRYGSELAPRHIWCGVSVEDHTAVARIRHLQMAPVAVRFLSIEPLLGPLGDVDIGKISWIIVGGESGPNARPMKEQWVIDIRDLCVREKVHFFFKQWGGKTPKAGGRLLEGSEHNAVPVRIFPERSEHRGGL